MAAPTTPHLSELIKSFGAAIARGGSRPGAAIDEIEGLFDVQLPSDFRQFLGNYGFLDGEIVHVFGLPGADDDLPSLAAVTLALRLGHADTPLELVPIQHVEGGFFACQVCAPQRTSREPVVLLDGANPRPVAALTVLASSFTEYLTNCLVATLPETPAAPVPFERTWAHFEEHVRTYNQRHHYDHAQGGKLPRNHEWRPYRYCIQDVVFGVTVVRHHREDNCLEVDVFLTADVPAYGPLAGARALAHFLPSEAYKCGGTMELRFTPQVEGGRVPQELCDLAAHYGLTFAGQAAGRIAPAEAKALYAALTDFSPALRARLADLESAGRIKLARACYVVNHGVWTREQIELIAFGSERPDSILGGMARPSQRHLYYHDLCHARAALLADMLTRLLLQRERVADSGATYDMEDDLRALAVEFDADAYAQVYRSDDDVPVPWLHGQERRQDVPGGMAFNVLIRARDAADMLLHLAADVKQAADLRLRTRRPTLLLVPRDFNALPDAARDRLLEQIRAAQIGLLVCPEEVATFDAEAAQRLARSRILRQ